jgi:hypothetical protein
LTVNGGLGDVGQARIESGARVAACQLSNRPLGSVLVSSTALKRVMLVLASGALAVTGLLVAPSASAQQAPPLNYSVRTSVADLAHVQDGDPLRITISGLPAGASAEWQICPVVLPDNLVTFRGDPNHAASFRVNAYCGQLNDVLSGSQFPPAVTSRGRSASTGDITFDVPVPRGSSTPRFLPFDPSYTNLAPSSFLKWPNNPNKNRYSFTCDENNPCNWMLHITGTPPGATGAVQVYDPSIKFTPSAPGIKIQGCGGIGASTLDASVPERFGRTLVGWNQLLCAPTRAAQPTNIVAENEDTALKSFDTGASTIAITGSGSALADQHVRDRQYVPVGLNAAVVAAVGWSPIDRTEIGDPLASKLTDSLKFSWDDLANLLSKGGEQPAASGRGGIFQDTSALVPRNAALAAIHMYNGSAPQGPEKRTGISVETSYFGATGEAGAGSVPLRLSSTLAKFAPRSWVYGTSSEFINLAGKPVPGSGTPVGTVTDLTSLNLGSATIHNVDTKSGRTNVRKQVNDVTLGVGAACGGGCLNWVVTDLATATEYGWTPVAVPNGQGGYVAPTPQSLQAAAAHLTPGADGSLAPGDTSGDPNAYPLTFVESIAAPLNPLVDANCRPEKAKQDQLTTLLRAAINGGQAAMGPGLIPLGPDLLATAQTAAAKVGTGTSAAACKENIIAKATAAGNSPLAGSGSGTTIPPGSLGLPGSPLPAATASPLPNSLINQEKAPSAASVLDARNLADSVRIPGFSGAGPLGALAPLLALAVLVILPSATAYLMAGRPLPPWLAQFLQETGDRLSWLGQRARGMRFAAAGGGA